jgi:GT2 family glycosyltransferase
MRDFDHLTPRTVDQPMASCLLLRAVAARRVGLFDEQFRIFFNDVDLSWRFYEQGWRIDYLPSAAVLHHGGGSTRQVKPAMVRESRDALLAYYAKHYQGRLNPVVYRATVGLIRLAFWWRLKKGSDPSYRASSASG